MREERENMIDDYFREGLDNLNVIPPADVWDNISRNLPDKKRNRKLFVWIAVAASVSLFAAFSGWNYLNRTENNIIHQPSGDVAGNIAQQKNSDVPVLNPEAKESKPNDKESIRSTEVIVSSDIKKENQNNAPVIKDPVKNKDVSQQSGSLANNGSQPARTPANIGNSENSAESLAVEETKNLKPDVSTQSDNYSLASAIEFRSFETPATYGVVLVKPSAVKIDSLPVYEKLYAIEEFSQPREKSHRWAIGGQMAPLYTYRAITDINGQGLSKAMMDQSEKAVFAYASGIKVDYEASSRLTLQTGIYYMRMGQEIENVSTLTPLKSAAIPLNSFADAQIMERNQSPAYTNSTGTIVASSPDLYANGTPTVDGAWYAPGNLAAKPAGSPNSKDIEQSFEFIEVPFLAKYKLINRKINLHLLGGLSTHMLVNNKIKLMSDNSTNYGSTSDVETMNYSSSVGFGVVYKMRKNLLFSVEPTFKYYLNSFNSNDIVKLHPYAFGLYSGISFKF